MKMTILSYFAAPKAPRNFWASDGKFPEFSGNFKLSGKFSSSRIRFLNKNFPPTEEISRYGAYHITHFLQPCLQAHYIHRVFDQKRQKLEVFRDFLVEQNSTNFNTPSYITFHFCSFEPSYNYVPLSISACSPNEQIHTLVAPPLLPYRITESGRPDQERDGMRLSLA